MEPVTLTRRQLLAAGLAGGCSAVMSGCSGLVKTATSVKPAGSDLGAIDHVVFLMHENRSFDHYFGTYRGVRGFHDHPPDDPGVFAQTWRSGAAPRLLPFHLDTLSTNAECTKDLSHAWAVQHRCWNLGRMDQFVATHTEPGVEGPSFGTLTMGYYTRADLDFYYALADAFTIGDAYFCSAMGPTQPNRVLALSGTIDPGGHRGGPSFDNSGAQQFDLRWETMPERLEAAGVSWKTYNAPGNAYQPTNQFANMISDNILLSFARYQDSSSALYHKAFGPIFPRDFARDVANDTLPHVSWLTPPNGVDEHPPAPPAVGMQYSHQVLSILTSNPRVWAKTVLFIMHDENDGFFDHVPPPTPPPGTPGEYLTVDPLPSGTGGFAGPIGLGFRVPLLVISPFSRGGYVCSDTFDHTSQLRFLETRFGVRAPNISSWRRGVTGDLTTTLQLGSRDTSVPVLPTTGGRTDPRVRAECSAAQLAAGDLDTAPYPVPRSLTLPTQEPGPARRRVPSASATH